MRHRRHAGKKYPIRVEDIALAVLGFFAGPLLWWMSQTWQQNSAATSIQTMEYWIALLCGLLSISLSTLWCIILVFGVAFAIAVKTKNKFIGYWADRFTPKFLQRLIISVIGIQLTFGSQALAAEHHADEPTASVSVENPFMPQLADVAEPPAPATTPSEMSETKVPTSTPSTRSPVSPSVDAPPPTPEPRHSSQLTQESTPEPAVTKNVATDDVEPMPRQTTTIPVPHDAGAQLHDHDTASPAPTESYVPEQPVQSPYITPLNPDRENEDPTHVVQRGDSLWDIAHQELGEHSPLSQIDQRWRQWWEHNRETLGDNPHALSPGTVLKAPPFTH